VSGLGRLEAQVHPGFHRLTDGAKLERSDPWSGSGRRPAPAGLAQLKGRLAVQVHPEFHRLTDGAKLERSDPWSGSGRRPAPAGLAQLKSRLAVQVHPEFHRLTNGAKLERSDPWSDSGRRPASAGLDQRSAPPSVSGPGALGLSQHVRPGAACSSATRGPPPAGSRPATRHRLGSPGPR
jgi:hypothetical protein